MHEQQPGLLQKLLGASSDPTRPFGSLPGKAMLAGIAAIGLRKMMKR
jgi:hypothetical protein